MPPKPAEIFQGSDWLTYRWSVAQAFDTLDRIRDLCLQMPVITGNPVSGGAPAFVEADEDVADIFGYIVELCDDLAGELDTVHADLASLLQGNTLYRWYGFEMQLHLKNLRFHALREAEAQTPAHTPPDAITTLAVRIKTLLKQIDQ